MFDANGIAGAFFLAACLVVAGIVAVVGGVGWLAYFLWCHLDVRWIP